MGSCLSKSKIHHGKEYVHNHIPEKMIIKFIELRDKYFSDRKYDYILLDYDGNLCSKNFTKKKIYQNNFCYYYYKDGYDGVYYNLKDKK